MGLCSYVWLCARVRDRIHARDRVRVRVHGRIRLNFEFHTYNQHAFAMSTSELIKVRKTLFTRRRHA